MSEYARVVEILGIQYPEVLKIVRELGDERDLARAEVMDLKEKVEELEGILMASGRFVVGEF